MFMSHSQDSKKNPLKHDQKQMFMKIIFPKHRSAIIKSKAKNTVVLQKESPTYYSKFKRYARSKNSIHAHVPSNIEVNEGDIVVAAECRPLSKSVSFVIIEVNP